MKNLEHFICICCKLGMRSVSVTQLTCDDMLLLLGNSFVIVGFISVVNMQLQYKLVIQLRDTLH